MNMIKIQNISFQYAHANTNALKNISLTLNKGECVVLCGESGCGKTTVTRLINGLIPHYYKGKLSGSVLVKDLNVIKSELYETASIVGSVFQNPRSQFFCVDTTSEIAFGCENMGLSVDIVKKRIEEAVTSLEMQNLLERNIFQLSGGEKQKVACASISAMHPDVIVLDEPTSNLDTDAIESLKKTLQIWKSKGKTIIIAEHRLYWLKDICDRVIYMKNGEIDFDIPMEQLLLFSGADMNQLGLRMLSIKDMKISSPKYEGPFNLKLKNYHFAYDRNPTLNIPTLSLPIGATIAVIGHNGAGKSTFTHCLCGLKKKFRGSVNYKNIKYNRKKMQRKCYMVMQDINHQLFCESVVDEVQLGMNKENEDKVFNTLASLGLENYLERHPMSLSGGQKQRVAIAAAMLAEKEVLVFDEPTSGLDFHNMEKTSTLISSLRGDKTVFVITHDPELIIRCCTHVLHLEDGNVVENYALPGKEKQLLSFFRMA